MKILALLPALLALTPSTPARGQHGMVNVAASRWGLSSAVASSVYGPDYAAANVLDGRWSRRETDKWNTAANRTPHWVRIDLGRTFPVCRVVIRHEGVLAEGDRYNTRDFRLQAAPTAAGPWRDLVPPVRRNRESVSQHDFAPSRLRFIRLLVDSGEPGGNEFARIFEIEAYAQRTAVSPPLLALSVPYPVRMASGSPPRIMARAEVAGVAAGPLRIRVRGTAGTAPVGPDGSATLALPADRPAAVQLLADGRPLCSADWTPPGRAYLARGALPVISSSHQDIAWMDTPQACREYRDRGCITPALGLMARNPAYRFVMENMLNLMEYLETHPERRSEVAQLTRAGRMEWGATLNQPYEAMLSGEQLVRETYFGRRWLRKTLPGCDARVAFNPDVPAMTLQMPQILAKAGIPYLIFSRYHEGLYRWKSPDGSSILAWTPGHYGNSHAIFNSPPADAVRALDASLDRSGAALASRSLPANAPLIHSADFSRPTDFGPLMAAWNRPGRPGELPRPRMAYSSARDFFEALRPAASRLTVRMGERPDVWLYKPGPTHHDAISLKREAAVLLPAAEAFSVLRALIEGSFAHYPAARLSDAWMASIYDDHGWGGKNGDITDAFFLSKHRLARDTARDTLMSALGAIAARVRAPVAGRSIVVFNALSWQRDDIADAPAPQAGPVRVVDEDGRAAPAQLMPASPAEGRPAPRLLFLARATPSLGYRRWIAVPARAPEAEPSGVTVGTSGCSNAFYSVTLAPGGIRAIVDRQTGRSLLRTDRWLAGEVFTLQSVGTGAGEFSSVQQPTMEGFDRLSRLSPTWRLDRAESGALFATWRLEQRFDHCTIRERLRVHHTIKRIDLDIWMDRWDGTKYREYRVAFPVGIPNARVAYEAPMAAIEVGRSEVPTTGGQAYPGVNYSDQCRDIHPREVQNWVHAGNGSFGMTLSTSVSVCDYVDPTTAAGGPPLLQPLLLASRRSCHGEGNWFLQTGDHHFAFSITSGPGDWRAGWRAGVAPNNPLLTAAGTPHGGDLAPSLSLLPDPGRNLAVSAVKRAEDDDRVVVRLCEMNGAQAHARIRLAAPVSSAHQTNLIEDPVAKLPLARLLRIPVGAYAIETLSLSVARRR